MVFYEFHKKHFGLLSNYNSKPKLEKLNKLSCEIVYVIFLLFLFICPIL